MPPNRTSVDVEKAIAGIVRGLDALTDAVDAIQSDAKSAHIDQARINTQLEHVLSQLTGLVGTVRGDKGLTSRVAVLESHIAQLRTTVSALNIEKTVEGQIAPVRVELAALRKDLDELKALINSKTEGELAEARDAPVKNRNHRVATWSAVLSLLTLLVTVGFFVLKECSLRTTGTSPGPPSTGSP